MTNEEYIFDVVPFMLWGEHNETPLYQINTVLSAMDAAREDEAVGFNRWRDGQSWECTLHDDDGVKHWQRYGEGKPVTDKELYQLYLKHKNEKL